MSSKIFMNSDEAATRISHLAKTFALVKNPDYVHPAYEIYPLAEKLEAVEDLAAVVMDMDGTTTTTEELCIYSLEYAVRRMSGKMDKESWSGLTEEDYPNIIGNSTTKHVEYLIGTYKEIFNEEKIKKAFIHSALWTLRFGKDAARIEEVKTNLKHFNLNSFTEREFIKKLKTDEKLLIISEEDVEKVYESTHVMFGTFTFSDLVRIGIDIYYQKYHEILERIKTGSGSKVSEDLFGDADKLLIEPMKGVLFFLCLIKGWVDNEKIIEEFAEEFESVKEIKLDNLKKLAKKFNNNPAKTSIVTSSIFYEADIVMSEVFKILSDEIDHYSFTPEKKNFLKEKFASYRNVYDAFISATDSSEIRLKPHRDLYSIALHRMNISKKEFNKVIGFEDSESGTIAIRAAGIGLCVAVPFAQTAGHNLEAASHICKEGLPEVLLRRNLFINLK